MIHSPLKSVLVCFFTQQHQALFYECSAHTGSNLEELMMELARYGVLTCTRVDKRTFIYIDSDRKTLEGINGGQICLNTENMFLKIN